MRILIYEVSTRRNDETLFKLIIKKGNRTVKKLLIIASILLSTHVTAANAEDYWAACDSCTATQMSWQAQETIPLDSDGVFSVYVMDFTNEKISKFSVVSIYDVETRMYFSGVSEVQVDPVIAADFISYVVALKNDIAMLEAGTDIPSTVVRSAFDLFNNSYNQNAVGSYVSSNLDFWQTVGAYTAIPLLALKKITVVNVVIPVTFSDGSTANFEITGVTGDLSTGVIEIEFQYQVGTAKDADGNSIPEFQEEADPFVGSFSTPQSANQMEIFLTGMFSGTSYSCKTVQDGENVVLTCKKT